MSDHPREPARHIRTDLRDLPFVTWVQETDQGAVSVQLNAPALDALLPEAGSIHASDRTIEAPGATYRWEQAPTLGEWSNERFEGARMVDGPLHTKWESRYGAGDWSHTAIGFANMSLPGVVPGSGIFQSFRVLGSNQRAHSLSTEFYDLGMVLLMRLYLAETSAEREALLLKHATVDPLMVVQFLEDPRIGVRTPTGPLTDPLLPPGPPERLPEFLATLPTELRGELLALAARRPPRR